MPRLRRLAACGALVALLAGCTGGGPPTQPDVERQEPPDSGLDDPARKRDPGVDGRRPSPPAQSPVDEPASEEEGVAP